MLSTENFEIKFTSRDVSAWGADKEGDQKPTLNLDVARKRRPWFEGLWANANKLVDWSYRAQPA